jgi:lauroyl/myristoyl acyltransferase
MSPEAVMNEYYKLLQRELEEEPWNYLWSHKRWK